MGKTLTIVLRYVDSHVRRRTLTKGKDNLPSEQFLADCLDVWKTRPVLESREPVSRYDRVNLSLRTPLHLWIESEYNEEGGH